MNDDGLACEVCDTCMEKIEEDYIDLEPTGQIFKIVEKFQCECGATLLRESEHDERGTLNGMWAEFDETTSSVWKSRRVNW